MGAGAPFSGLNHTALQALEILRLIADRMEQKDTVDKDDLLFLLSCLSDVTLPCMNGASPNHAHIRAVFGELTGKVDSGAEEFVSLSRVYTNLLADAILLEKMDEAEFELSAARERGGRLHRLELKYVRPHCI